MSEVVSEQEHASRNMLTISQRPHFVTCVQLKTQNIAESGAMLSYVHVHI